MQFHPRLVNVFRNSRRLRLESRNRLLDLLSRGHVVLDRTRLNHLRKLMNHGLKLCSPPHERFDLGAQTGNAIDDFGWW